MKITHDGYTFDGTPAECAALLQELTSNVPIRVEHSAADKKARRKIKRQVRVPKYICPDCQTQCQGAMGLGIHRRRWCKVGKAIEAAHAGIADQA